MELYLYGEKISGDTRTMIDSGIALVPEDRLSTGLVPSLSICENMVLGYHRTKRFATRSGFLRLKKWRQFAREAIGRFGVKTPSSSVPVSSLSGGNQQKVVIARVLSEEPRFAIFAQPTRGVDIGASITSTARSLNTGIRETRRWSSRRIWTKCGLWQII